MRSTLASNTENLTILGYIDSSSAKYKYIKCSEDYESKYYMIKVILFDFWGTLVENGVWSPTKQVRNILEISIPLPEYVVRMEKSLMTRKFKDLNEAFTYVCKEFNIEPTEDKLEELIGVWNKNWMLAQPYEETKNTLQKLKEKYKLILIGNSDCFGVKNVLEKFEMKPLFDEMFFSYEIGMIKTDKSFLKLVLDKINTDIGNCVLVGDSLQSDIMTAKKIGMKTVLIDRRNSRNFNPKIKNLNELTQFLD